MNIPHSTDAELAAVKTQLRKLDPTGSRTAQVLRDTLDQLYDGQRTRRYRWDQLHKTEKTHCGTLVEINLHREFCFEDGDKLDYRIAGVDVDCKYSQKNGAWMIPPEAEGELCLVVWAEDAASEWSMGLVRATSDRLSAGSNRDRKAQLNPKGREAITWLFNHAALPPNVLLQLDRAVVDKIMALGSGQQRVNELFRATLGLIVGRAVVATVAQQDDYMKRVRANGGARSTLQPEGILVLGQYESHRSVVRQLGIQPPGPGETLSVRVAPASNRGPGVALIDRRLWKVATSADPIVAAPELPSI